MIFIHDIRYAYPNGTVALNNISLRIEKGEFVAIMGQNGAGKTTLIRTLNGLIRPTEGAIYINGVNTESKTIAELSRNVGVIFQNPSHQLFSNTLEDEIKFSLKTLDLSKEEIQSKTEETLEEFNLLKFRERSPLNLSGGESKKLAIASIICRDPEILIFDEPTLGQDAREIEFFIKLLEKERKKGKTIVIVTHNIEFTYEYIPRTILMARGKIIADGPTHNILTNRALVEKGSLVLPQIYRFIEGLNKVGIDVPRGLFSEQQVVEFVDEFLTKRLSK